MPTASSAKVFGTTTDEEVPPPRSSPTVALASSAILLAISSARRTSLLTEAAAAGPVPVPVQVPVPLAPASRGPRASSVLRASDRRKEATGSSSRSVLIAGERGESGSLRSRGSSAHATTLANGSRLHAPGLLNALGGGARECQRVSALGLDRSVPTLCDTGGILPGRRKTPKPQW